MRFIATDGVAWSVRLSVCLLVTFVSPAKTAEPIEMSIGRWSGGPKEPCIRWGSTSDNPFASARGDKSAMRPFVKILLTARYSQT